MIFEQDETYLEASRSGPNVEFEFWSRGRHRGFVQLPVSHLDPAIREGRDVPSKDGLHIKRDETGEGWVFEFSARNFKTRIRLSEDEFKRALSEETEPK